MGRRHLPDGGIQLLQVKLGMCSIGWCPPIVPPHPGDYRNGQRFVCIFCRRRFPCWLQPLLNTVVTIYNKNWDTALLINLFSFYSYVWGVCRQQWLPFRSPLLAVNERYWLNIGSSSSNKLKSSLFCCFIQNQAQALLPKSFQRGSPCRIGQIHISHTVRVRCKPGWDKKLVKVTIYEFLGCPII